MKNGDSHSEAGAKSTAEKIEKVIEDVAARGRALADEGLESVREIWENNAEKLKQKAAEWGVDEAVDDVRSYVRKNPWKSVAIAAGVGLIAGILFRSSNSRNDD